MVLGGYFDESERVKGLDPFTVAGYVFKPNAYKQFARRWKGLCSRTRVPIFHTTDLFAGEGGYEHLSMHERATVFSEAVDIINKHMTVGIGFSLHQKEFEAAAPDWAQRSGSIYTLTCNVCLEMAGDWMNERRPYDLISYVFENGHKFQHEANALLDAIGSDEKYSGACHYHSHQFMPKSRACGLQAADIVAWAATKEYGFETGDKIPEPFLRTLRRMAEDRSKYVLKLATGDGLTALLTAQRRAMAEGRMLVWEAPPRKRALR